ncbi:MAG: hypothetical protein QXD04_03325 [Candidatus Bathyarchaeia archaeon]
MSRRRFEEWFERRIQRRFERVGCVVINAARSRPVDLIVFPPSAKASTPWPSHPIFVELKARRSNSPRGQEEMQRGLAEAAGVNWIRIRQAHPRGHIRVEACQTAPPDDESCLASLMNIAFGDLWRPAEKQDDTHVS